MKKIMILGASILQLPAIQKAKDMGLEVIVVDMNPEAVGFKVAGIQKKVISTIDVPAVIEEAKRHEIDGIITLASDMPMRTIAKVAEQLGLAGVTEETAYRATNKAMMREVLGKYDVPIPAFFKVSTKEEFERAIKEIQLKNYRCIVKPVDNSGSRGVVLLENYENDIIDKAYDYCRKYSRSGDVMVEEYMEGLEVSVETLTVEDECHVIQITDKVTTGAPYFVEMGHSQPSQLSDDIQEKIIEITKLANKAIGIQSGPSHTEIIVTSEGPKIVEIGARLGGDNITTHLVPLSTGVDMVEACIKIALGEKPDISIKYNKASAIQYLNVKQGVIKSIKGVEKAKKIKGIQQVFFVHGIGEKVTEIKNSIDRVGFVIAQAETAERARAICESAVRKIEVVCQ